jgi:signal peptidase
MVSHRVLSIEQGPEGLLFQTKGDANTDPDRDKVAASQVIGKVSYDLPYLGRVVERLRDRQTYYIVIGIPAALLILNEIWVMASELRQHRARARSANPVPNNDAAEGAS